MIPFDWIVEAGQRIKDQVKITPLTYDEGLNIHLKWENHQVTGSFKARGALNKVLSLQEWERRKGLVTCSAGNHGQGVALAARSAGSHCLVFASDHASPIKIDAMQKLGAELRLVEGGYAQAEALAKEFAARENFTFVSPYNDVQVISGQGTIGLELADQTQGFHNVKSILVPVGGGGLVCGIAAALEGLSHNVRITGVQSESSAYAHAQLTLGSQDGVRESESLADGLAGEIDHESITIPLMKEYVGEMLLVSEAEIATAIRYAWEEYHERIEGSAAVSLAACLAGKISERPIVVIITGGNIDPEVFAKLTE